MKTEELIFVNEQIAGMLSSGVPLEGALEQVARELRGGKYARELEAFKDDLAGGVEFIEAVKKRKFPELYQQMLIIGAKTDKLPMTLNAIADYYRKKSETVLRLSGMMVYPIIVLTLTLILLAGFTVYVKPLLNATFSTVEKELMLGYYYDPIFQTTSTGDWFFMGLLLAIILLILIIYICPFLRTFFYWRLSPFREVALSNTATLMAICLKNGMPLSDAYTLMIDIGSGISKREMRKIKDSLEKGVSHDEAVRGTYIYPPFFQWILKSSGEKLEEGFESASELYSARASYRIDLVLYAVLPTSTILLAIVIFSQLYSYMTIFIKLVRLLDKFGG